MFSAKYVAMSPRYCSPSTRISIPISSWNRIHSEVAFSSSVRKPSGESSPFDAFVRARVRYSGFGRDHTLVVRRVFRRPPPLSERPCEESAVSVVPGLSDEGGGRGRTEGGRPAGRRHA